ncbi:thiamine-phosphate kinase [Erythrobacter sp. QSSC1-22B]|uniref:thiamine-phosphate kinase n=1 Tax=Erythrobacter sp. QSSC1-22B TaxID=1860125 RepID=UPI0008054CC9|nr:thiamine-phosphate kinase [Erythrobacter sp. QSSC1-22B]OBX18486.1 thiamine-phosphate kinase [Erythrobacter sp. QSSC1-22B]
MTESDFIAALRALAVDPAARGLADDAAVLEFGGETLVLTHDVLVEGVHVLPASDPADIAWKLVAVNLSDLAAKGAEPVGILLGHMLGDGDERFLQGLHAVLDAYGVPLLGGDTVKGGAQRSWGVTALGRATHIPAPSRSGAQVGDGVFVTGTLGAAMLGHAALTGGAEADTIAYLRPTPLLAEGRALAPLVSAMMDVSDGVLLDAWRLASASGVTLELDSAAIPVADEARRGECLRWGDDYQLLFTAPADAALPVAASRIGTVAAHDSGVLRLDGHPLSPDDGLGYTHG